MKKIITTIVCDICGIELDNRGLEYEMFRNIPKIIRDKILYRYDDMCYSCLKDAIIDLVYNSHLIKEVKNKYKTIDGKFAYIITKRFENKSNSLIKYWPKIYSEFDRDCYDNGKDERMNILNELVDKDFKVHVLESI